MFCGGSNHVKHFDLKLSVFVFPSLSFVDEYYADYFNESSSIPNSSSDSESTTEIDIITKLSTTKYIKKKILITHQRFNQLLNNLQGDQIDICCFHEAHHAVRNAYFNDDFQ